MYYLFRAQYWLKVLRNQVRLYLSGDASALLGDEWKGYRFVDNLFYVPEWSNGFPPHEIRAMFWKVQQLWSLQREIELLKQELDRRNEDINTLEVRVSFYKRQLVLESRFGMILERTFS